MQPYYENHSCFLNKNSYNERIVTEEFMKRHFYHQAILEICAGHHLDADDIFDRVREQFPQAGFSTIYRNVEELAESGDLRKISGIGKKALFERVVEDHVAHFVDRETGEVYDLAIPREWLYEKLPAGFRPDAVDVRFYGRAEVAPR
jgi:Fur family transcriptional regulator, peroxide stress response regulator